MKSLVVSCFVLSFFTRDALDEIWDRIKSVSEEFSYLPLAFCASGRGYCCLRLPSSLQQTDLNPLERASFNITIIEVYAPTSGHDDSGVDHLFKQLQETVNQTPKQRTFCCTRGLKC